MGERVSAKTCAHCGNLLERWRDRTYCSVACANRAIAAKTKIRKSWTRVVVLGDVHIPFQDQRVVSLVLMFIKEYNPNVVILNGDIVDCYDISSFDKDPQREASLVQELREAKEFFEKLRECAPTAEIRYVYGNHEHRFHKYIIRNARSLAGLIGISLAEQLELSKFGITPIATSGDRFTDNYTKVGTLLVGHFDKVCKHSAYTAKLLLDDYGCSLIQAHVHSIGSSNRTLDGGEIMGWEGGCLCDLRPLYCKPKKWAHAFHVIQLENDGNFFHVDPIHIINYKFWWGDELWQG